MGIPLFKGGVFPVRIKIILLLTVALTASLLSYLVLGRTLITRDKTSYIYDATLAQAKTAADLLQNRMDRAITLAKLLPKVLDFSSEKDRKTDKQVKQIFENLNSEQLVSSLAFLVPSNDDSFTVKSHTEKSGSTFVLDPKSLGWTPSLFEKTEFIASLCGEKKLCLGARTLDLDKHAAVGSAQIELADELLKSENQSIQLYLAGADGRPFLASKGAQIPATDFKEMANSQFPSGARDIELHSKDFIASYQQIPKYKLTVIGVIAKEEAFISARLLVLRSTVLGLSILVLAIAFSWFFAKGTTQRLRQMWLATQKVSQGDFSVRVDSNKGNDEVTGLAKSFNAMADRINELLKETATKARMEKELETAQVVQSRFFPREAFIHDHIQLGGQALAATECGGDWWNYHRIGNYLIVGCGDVTGHGVSSALVTAAAHAAFYLSTAKMEEEAQASPNYIPDLKELILAINRAILAAGGGDTQMTMILNSFNLDTGSLRVINAGHRPPYVWRADKAAQDTHFKKRIDILNKGGIPPLGTVFTEIADPIVYFLRPGDSIIWYTDGLVESENKEGKRRHKHELLIHLDQLCSAGSQHPSEISLALLKSVLDFMGEKSSNLDDDITIATAIVPQSAKFIIQEPPAFHPAPDKKAA